MSNKKKAMDDDARFVRIPRKKLEEIDAGYQKRIANQVEIIDRLSEENRRLKQTEAVALALVVARCEPFEPTDVIEVDIETRLLELGARLHKDKHQVVVRNVDQDNSVMSIGIVRTKPRLEVVKDAATNGNGATAGEDS
jgi:hypothetical protein